MKKIMMLLLCIVTLFGCTTHNEEKQDPQFVMYTQIKDILKKTKQRDELSECDITLMFHELNDEYRYDIVIDNVSEDMYNIVAMAYAHEDDEQMCPTLGVFDDEPFHLKPQFVDKANGFYKGVQLSGTTLQKQNVLVYIRYYRDEKKQQEVEKVVEVKYDEIR